MRGMIRQVADSASTLPAIIERIVKRIGISHILLFIFALHMIQIPFPSDGSYVFDEAHYVPASIATLNGQPANAEHPPLSKIIAAIGIAILGNNWFGWRFPQVLMHLGVLYLFYLISKRMLGDPWALGATMLLGFDTLFFIHGGILMLDTAALLFGLLALHLYLRGRYAWSAVAMGLALLSRIQAIFIFATLAVHLLYANRRSLRLGLRMVARYLFIAALVFGILLWAYDAAYRPPSGIIVKNYLVANVITDQAGKPVTTITTTAQSTTAAGFITNPIDHVLFMLRYHGPGGIVLNEPYRPYQYAWNWVIPSIDPNDFPTYYRTDITITSPEGVKHYVPIWYIAALNPAVIYGFWPMLLALGVAFWQRRDIETVVLAGAGLACSYTPWLLMSMLVRRIGFNYYMIWSMPFIALGLAFAWKTLVSEEYGRLGLAFNVIIAFVWFLKFFPVHPFP
jgi:4-amino-4-deoxy-L-arabinose transferase-like glycosyltransferase